MELSLTLNKKLYDEYWSRITHSELFYKENIEALPKSKIVKISQLMELRVSPSMHKIFMIDMILKHQDKDNPFIVWYQGYDFNPNVNFWKYLEKAKKYTNG